MISRDARLSKMLSDLTLALLDDDVPKYISALKTSLQIAESYLVKIEKQADVELTKPMPMIPFPPWMGLEGIAFSQYEPFLVDAFPGNGKTLFCANLAAFLTKGNLRVTIFQNEGRPEDYLGAVYRVLQSITTDRRIRKEELYSEQEKLDANKWAKTAKLKIENVENDGPKELIARMTRLMSRRGCDVILFDWFQNIKLNNQALKFDALAWLARQFTELSAQWGIPIGIFGQINRDGGREKLTIGAPGLGVLEGCPTMEQKAALVITMKSGPSKADAYNEYKGPSFFWLNVAKNRHGPNGQRNVKCDFNSGGFLGPLDPDEMDRFLEYTAAQRKGKK